MNSETSELKKNSDASRNSPFYYYSIHWAAEVMLKVIETDVIAI